MSRLDKFQDNLMTASSAEYLAGLYGQGADMDSFAESLPSGARVIDVGAGLSDLGTQVVRRHPSIEWTNFDINYSADHTPPNTNCSRRLKPQLRQISAL